ncbi:MAG: hypothetical protein DWP97_04025 [Calditrichaeota bacterium]|nr:MAG: hypothetical protein DWP97_04025 [Calditrichota bacterium]
MNIKQRETVILANDYKAVVKWYVEILGFKLIKTFEDEYHYYNIKNESGIEIGIASAGEMGVELGDRKRNPVILQIEVEDVQLFFEYLKKNNVTTQFGPSFDKSGEFWYGAFFDLEGNPIWVVDKNCP